MIEKKELYISPEVEIICFAPVERLATTWGWGTGETPDDMSNLNMDIPVVTDPTGSTDIDEGESN